MTDSAASPGREAPAGVDTSVSHSARVWNYWLGGKDNYPVDQEAGEQIRAVLPDVADVARSQRGFLVRAVRYLTAEAGIRQFLDIGTGLPTAGNTHQVAQAGAPECRVVYVDNDPLVLVHARALLTSSPEGVTDYVDADLRDPDTILQQAARTLNFSRPIALMLLGIMEHVLDTESAYAIMDRLLDALAPGSYLVLCDATSEGNEEMAEACRVWNDSGGIPPVVARSHREIARFFGRVELLEPGLVSSALWCPVPSDIGDPAGVSDYCGVGRKP